MTDSLMRNAFYPDMVLIALVLRTAAHSAGRSTLISSGHL